MGWKDFFSRKNYSVIAEDDTGQEKKVSGLTRRQAERMAESLRVITKAKNARAVKDEGEK